jgi:hypothetical protein
MQECCSDGRDKTVEHRVRNTEQSESEIWDSHWDNGCLGRDAVLMFLRVVTKLMDSFCNPSPPPYIVLEEY